MRNTVDSQELYNALFSLRTRLALEHKGSVCSDQVLKSISEIQPGKLEDFNAVPGVGPAFISKYAKDFLEVINGFSQQNTSSVDLTKGTLNTLKELEKKLVNINRNNHLLCLHKLTGKTAVDIFNPDTDPRKIILDGGKMTTVAKKDDPDFSKIVALLRDANRNIRDKGQNDLFIAYPFVKGKIGTAKDMYNIRAPLALFPVKEERTLSSVKLCLDDSREILYNTTLILANFKFHGANKIIPQDEVEDTKKETFIESLLQFYAQCDLDIKKEENEEELHAMKSYTEATFPEYKNGELFLENTIVLGNFPICSSSIQKDFQQIAETKKINPLLDDLLSKKEFVPLDKSALNNISEKKLFYINSLNAAQENVLASLEMTDELVIQGPPGTGKSQTITSLIADFANADKTVLMVSEKKTALDVVYSRLGDLSKYTLLIDDVNNKANFYNQLQQTVELGVKNNAAPSPDNYALSIDESIASLKKVAADYFEKDSFGIEPYKLYLLTDLKSATEDEIFRLFHLIKQALPQEAYDMQYPQLEEAYNFFLDERNMDHTERYVNMTTKYPWLSNMNLELSDYEVKEMLLEQEPLLDTMNQWKEKNFFGRIFSRSKVAKQIKEFSSKYFTTVNGKLVSTFLKSPEDFKAGASSYIEFVQLKPYYDHLSESTKTYFQYLLKTKPCCCNEIQTANKALFQYLPTEHLMKFEASHREAFPYIKNFETIIKSIDTNMDKKRECSRKLLENQLSQNITNLSQSKRRAEILRVINSKRRWSVNKFVSKFELELFKSVKVWLMTPEVVSELLPLQIGLFDLVVFDEASQMFMEKGIPSILRGKKVVIAGDQKQLRPSKLGAGRFEIDEEDGVDGDFEEIEDSDRTSVLEEDSLLDLARFKYNDVLLNFHYRSKYEELIAFSNYAFYGGKLYVSPNTETPELSPIQVHRTQNGKWINRKNKEEAEEIVRLLKDFFKTRKEDETIGIITFNISQRDLIDDLIDKECEKDPEFAVAISREMNRKKDGEDIGLFVKNIESVQGDERDVIMFSMGYAKNEKGKLVQNFGWLNQSGGENRLNVAISRAKKQIHIVVSFDPSELKVDDSKNQGPFILKKYLEYAFAISAKNTALAKQILNSFVNLDETEGEAKPAAAEVTATEASAPVPAALPEDKDEPEDFGDTEDSGSDAESDEAEEKPAESSSSKAPELSDSEHTDSRFLDQVFQALTDKGLQVERNVGIGGYTIDFAIKKENRYILGIECDSKLYKNSGSVRERDFYRQKYLESRGWKIHRLWSILWAKDQQKEIEKILALVK